MTNPLRNAILLALTVASLGATSAFAADAQVSHYIVHADKYQIPYAGDEKEFNHKINPGYGSAIVLKDVQKDGTVEFYGITDRGPNADIPVCRQRQDDSGQVFPDS